jgi:hypothetical protein
MPTTDRGGFEVEVTGNNAFSSYGSSGASLTEADWPAAQRKRLCIAKLFRTRGAQHLAVVFGLVSLLVTCNRDGGPSDIQEESSQLDRKSPPDLEEFKPLDVEPLRECCEETNSLQDIGVQEEDTWTDVSAEEDVADLTVGTPPDEVGLWAKAVLEVSVEQCEVFASCCGWSSLCSGAMVLGYSTVWQEIALQKMAKTVSAEFVFLEDVFAECAAAAMPTDCLDDANRLEAYLTSVVCDELADSGVCFEEAWKLLVPTECRVSLRGEVETGGECSDDGDCVNFDICHREPGLAVGFCDLPSELGQPCVSHLSCTGDLYCVGGFCDEAAEETEPCEGVESVFYWDSHDSGHSGTCQSGLQCAVGVCSPLGKTGEPCGFDVGLWCEHGAHCDWDAFDMEYTHCTALLPAGSPCSEGVCFGYCDADTLLCAEAKKDGLECTADSECLGTCDSVLGICEYAPTPGLKLCGG